MKYIPLDAVLAEIEKCYNECLKRAKIIDSDYWNAKADAYRNVLAILIDTLEVKEIGVDLGDPKGDKSAKYIIDTKNLEVKEVDNSISKFKSLLHLHADMKSTCGDWGYAPTLYFFDNLWHVDWVSCTEGDSLIDFTDSTPEGAIQKAYEWFHSTFKNGG